MDKRFDQLKIKIIKSFSQCFYSSDNLKFMGQYFVEKFKNQHCTFEHRKLADEMQDAIFNKKFPPNIRYNAVQILKDCMQTNNQFLINYVELNTIEKFAKIAMMTKKSKYQLIFFGNLYDEVYSPLFFQEVLTCILLWSKKSSCYEEIFKDLQKQKVQFNLNVQQLSLQECNAQRKSEQEQSMFNLKKYSFKCLPLYTQKERVKLKIQLLQETLYFMYSCFVLQKMSDEISQILMVCNDIIASMEIEKDSLKLYKSNIEQVGQIQKLQLLLQHMNQNYTNGEPIKQFMKNYKQVLVEVLNIKNEKEEEQKIRKDYQNEIYSSIKSENIIYSLTSLTQIDYEVEHTRTSILNSNKNKISNMNQSLHHQTIPAIEIAKSYERSPYQINAYSLQSFPPSPRYNYSGSLNEEKSYKQTPLIYGMLKQLGQENILRTANNIKSLNQFEDGTPETKCATFHSINELQESQSQFSSHCNSPLIFSTTDPLYFEQVENISDNIMDVEYPNPQQQQEQQQTYYNQRRNTEQDIYSNKKLNKKTNYYQDTSKNYDTILENTYQQENYNSYSEPASKTNYTQINDVKYSQHYTQYQDFSSIIQAQKQQQQQLIHNQQQQQYSQYQPFNSEQSQSHSQQNVQSELSFEDEGYSYSNQKRLNTNQILQNYQQTSNNIQAQNQYSSQNTNQNELKISHLLNSQNTQRVEIDNEGIIYRNCKKQTQTINQDDNLYSQLFSYHSLQQQDKQQNMIKSQDSTQISNNTYGITQFAQERNEFPSQSSNYSQPQLLQNQQINCLSSSQGQYNTLRLPFSNENKQYQQRNNNENQTNIFPFQQSQQTLQNQNYNTIENNYSQISNQSVNYSNNSLSDIQIVGNSHINKQYKPKHSVNNSQNLFYSQSNLDKHPYEDFTSAISNITNQKRSQINQYTNQSNYSNLQQCYINNSYLQSTNSYIAQESEYNSNSINDRFSQQNLSSPYSNQYNQSNLNPYYNNNININTNITQINSNNQLFIY